MDLSKARVLFFEEAYELCDTLEAALLDPATYPPNTTTFNLIFRTAHTIKGSAGIFGLEALVRFAHIIENILERLRSNQLVLTDELVSLLLPATTIYAASYMPAPKAKHKPCSIYPKALSL